MQKKKKYLIVTIWISTIAFIGAGFVGWGTYNYGKKGGDIAKVGDIYITNTEFDFAYTNVYNEVKENFNGILNEELKEKLNLEKQAMSLLIDRAYMLNLAKSLGISISDSMIVKKILESKEFYKDGKFNKKIYETFLANLGIRAKDYEDNLRKSLSLDRLYKLINIKTTQKEINAISSVFYIADKIKYKILMKKDIKIEVKEEDTKKYWMKNKEKYMNPKMYELEILTIENKKLKEEDIKKYFDENKFKFANNQNLKLKDQKKEAIKELHKKEALKKYIKYKKGEKLEEKIKSIKVAEVNDDLPYSIMQEIKNLEVQDILKPKKLNNDFVIIKLIKKIPAKAKEYLDAKEEVKIELKERLKEEKLIKLAKNQLKNFEGKTSKFITRKDIKSIEGLDELETANFLNKLFQSKTKKSYVEFSQGVILYDILEQKLLKNNKKDIQAKELTSNIKNSILKTELIKKLRNEFSLKMYYKIKGN